MQEKKDQGAVAALVVDLAEAFEWVSLPVVGAWATHFNFPRGGFSSKDLWRSRSRLSRPSCQGPSRVKVELFASS